MMNNKEILDNAPEGATHVDAEHCYWDLRRCNDYHKVYCEDGIQDFGWFQTDDNPDVIGLRSLADIGRILELEEFIRRHRYSIKQNEGDATQRTINKLLDGEK